MPIGNSPDLPEYDRKEEDLVKLGDKVQDWWDNLDWNAKLEIYINENEKDYMSEDELYDGGYMSNFDNEEGREW